MSAYRPRERGVGPAVSRIPGVIYPDARTAIVPVAGRPDAFFVVERARPYAKIARCQDCGGHFAVELGTGRPAKHCHWCRRDRGNDFDTRKLGMHRSL